MSVKASIPNASMETIKAFRMSSRPATILSMGSWNQKNQSGWPSETLFMIHLWKAIGNSEYNGFKFQLFTFHLKGSVQPYFHLYSCDIHDIVCVVASTTKNQCKVATRYQACLEPYSKHTMLSFEPHSHSVILPMSSADKNRNVFGCLRDQQVFPEPTHWKASLCRVQHGLQQ